MPHQTPPESRPDDPVGRGFSRAGSPEGGTSEETKYL